MSIHFFCTLLKISYFLIVHLVIEITFTFIKPILKEAHDNFQSIGLLKLQIETQMKQYETHTFQLNIKFYVSQISFHFKNHIKSESLKGTHTVTLMYQS